MAGLVYYVLKSKCVKKCLESVLKYSWHHTVSKFQFYNLCGWVPAHPIESRQKISTSNNFILRIKTVGY